MWVLALALIVEALGQAPESTRGLNLTPQPAPTAPTRIYRRAVAVVIGIDRYAELPESRQLAYAVSDARAVAAVIGERFAFDEVRTLYDGAATREGIVELFDGLRVLERDDALFVFWAGHGVSERLPRGEEVGYLVPADGSLDPAEYVVRNVSMRMLRDDLLARVPAKHVFVVVDACYGGLFQATRGGEAVPGPLTDAYLAEILREPVIVALSAGKADQEVLDGGPDGHSVFTGRFLERLGQVGGLATATEVAHWVESRVTADAAARSHAQRPVWGRLEGLGDFVFEVKPELRTEALGVVTPVPVADRTRSAAPAGTEAPPHRPVPTAALVFGAVGVLAVAGWWLRPRRAPAPAAAPVPGPAPGPESDALVGRREDLEAIGREVRSGGRLVVVLGPGGAGKTALASAWRSAHASEFATTWWVDLTNARSTEDVCFAVAGALGFGPAGSATEQAEQVGRALAARGRALVVLDNFEQVADTAPETVARWSRAATELVLLVTSRERLRVEGERAVPTGPLPPDEAVVLFAARARAADPTFDLDPHRDVVVEIVERLDRMPLAIELAAARVRMLPPRDLLRRLSEGPAALRSERRDAVERHASVEATIAWSWDLLAPNEQEALACSGQFRGGFRLEDAEGLFGADGLDLVQALLDKSLLRRTGDRFDLYVAVRTFVQSRLGAGDPERFARLWARRAAELVDAARHARDREPTDRMTAELPNLEAAFGAALRVDRGVALAVFDAIAAALWIQVGEWSSRRRAWTAPETFDRMLAAPGSDVDAVRIRLDRLDRHARTEPSVWPDLDAVLASRVPLEPFAAEIASARAQIAAHRRDWRTVLDESEAALRHLPADRWRVRGRVTTTCALAHESLGDTAASDRIAEQMLADAVREGDVWAEAQAVRQLWLIAIRSGDGERVLVWPERLLALARRIGHRSMEVAAMSDQAYCLFSVLRRLDEAERSYRALLAVAIETGDLSSEVHTRLTLIRALLAKQDVAGAAREWEVARRLAPTPNVERRALLPAQGAILQHVLGDLPGALALLDEALAARPLDGFLARVQAHRAAILALQGDSEGARRAAPADTPPAGDDARTVEFLLGFVRLAEARTAGRDAAGAVADLLARTDVTPGELTLQRLLRAEVERTPPPPKASPDFVGRARDLAALRTELAPAGAIVTLAGPGGSGKTRLAREVVRAWDGPTLFVELAHARDAEGVCAAVARELGVALGEDAALQVARALHTRGVSLVVLDNFEQVIQAAGTVAEWRERVPGARWLVTSREVLRIGEERVHALAPLTLPAGDDDGEAVALFRQRARAARADVALDTEVVRAIVRRLDGMPLAIELAAAQVRMVPPAGILERLGAPLELPASGRRDVPARQATLRATIDWSWSLLDEAERAAFAGCAVFRGGFTLRAAEAVLDAGPRRGVAEVLEALVDKSLVQTRDGRYGMLETLREYASERLGEAPPAAVDELRRRVVSWFAEGAWAEVDPALEAVLAEHENLLAALSTALELRDVAGVGSLGAMVYWIGERRGHAPDAPARWAREAAVVGDDARSDVWRATRLRLAHGAGWNRDDVLSAVVNRCAVERDLAGEIEARYAAIRLQDGLGGDSRLGSAGGCRLLIERAPELVGAWVYLAARLTEEGSFDEAAGWCERAVASPAFDEDDEIAIRARILLARLRGLGPVPPGPVVALHDQAVARAVEARHQRLEALARAHRSEALGCAGRWEEALGDARTAVRLSGTLGALREESLGHERAAQALLVLGRPADALDETEEALRCLASRGGPTPLLVRAEVFAALGRAASARNDLRVFLDTRTTGAIEAMGRRVPFVLARARHAVLRAEAGEPADGELGDAVREPLTAPVHRAWRAVRVAEHHRAAGDLERAGPALGEALALARDLEVHPGSLLGRALTSLKETVPIREEPARRVT